MLKNILPKTIRGKIMICTAVTTALIAAATVTVCYLVFQSFLRKNQIQSAEYNLQVISGNVTADMENIVYFNEWCQSNNDINRFLEAFRDHDRMPPISSEYSYLRAVALNTYDRLKEEYNNTHSSNYITRILVTPNNRRNYLHISDTATTNSSIAADTLYQCDFFDSLLHANGYLWTGFIKDPLNSFGEQLILPVVRPIYNQFNSEVIGWTYLSISDSLILNYLNTFPKETDSSLYVTVGSHTYLIQDGRLLETSLTYKMISDISEQTFNRESRAYQVQFADGQRRTIVTSPLWNEGWTISQVLSEQSYGAQYQVYTAIIAGIALVISLVGLLLYSFLNRMINRPVKQLQAKITDISQGDFSREPSIEWEDELGTIGKGINQMSENVVTLMNKKVEDEKQKKNLEYQILQSQINPHFLYNTLNSIKWMATIQGASGIAEMTTALARLMKNVSKGTAARIPLKEELELVNDYFLIQQYRYGGSLTMEYQIAGEDLYRCLIHRFTLQPIIENALFHGIEPKGCAGRILLKAEADITESGQHILRISITDNGIGMSPETIKKVLQGDTAPTADFFRQVGINNVNKRIQYDYGEAYGITIESELGEYTTMIITLPYLTAEGGTTCSNY